MNDLLKRLQTLGLIIEKDSLIKAVSDNKSGIDDVVVGKWVDSGEMRVFLAEKAYPDGYVHGCVPLVKSDIHRNLAPFWGMESFERDNLGEFLFIDVETSGLSLGTGSLIFLFGGCYFTQDGLQIVQFFLDDPSDEILFLNHIEELISRHKYLISYNGKSFDIPILRSRMLLNHLRDDNISRSHLDLLHFTRKIWRLRLDSRKLSDIEKEILNFVRTEDEVPGWLVPQVYFDYLTTADADPLKGVFYHNEKDVVSLAALFIYINQLISDQHSQIKADSLDLLAIGQIYQNSRNFSLSEDFYKMGFGKQNPDKLPPVILMHYAKLLKQRDKWPEALEFWKSAVEQNNPEACIELSKYFEHKEKNYPQAMKYVEKAAETVNRYPQKSNFFKELNHRRQRIQDKINHAHEK